MGGCLCGGGGVGGVCEAEAQLLRGRGSLGGGGCEGEGAVLGVPVWGRGGLVRGRGCMWGRGCIWGVTEGGGAAQRREEGGVALSCLGARPGGRGRGFCATCVGRSWGAGGGARVRGWGFRHCLHPLGRVFWGAWGGMLTPPPPPPCSSPPPGSMAEGWVECPALGPGWKRREAFRKSGATCGRTDTYYKRYPSPTLCMLGCPPPLFPLPPPQRGPWNTSSSLL